MMADKRHAILAERKGPLELSADRQEGNRAFDRQLDRRRRIAARSPKRQHLIINNLYDRIVAAHMDRPIVTQINVGDARKTLKGIVIEGSDRLIRDVAARHHEDGVTQFAHQKMMKR